MDKMVEVIVFTYNGSMSEKHRFFISVDEMVDVEYIIFDRYKFSRVISWEINDRIIGRRYEKYYH